MSSLTVVVASFDFSGKHFSLPGVSCQVGTVSGLRLGAIPSTITGSLSLYHLSYSFKSFKLHQFSFLFQNHSRCLSMVKARPGSCELYSFYYRIVNISLAIFRFLVQPFGSKMLVMLEEGGAAGVAAAGSTVRYHHHKAPILTRQHNTALHHDPTVITNMSLPYNIC